jgi:hypothetical protein
MKYYFRGFVSFLLSFTFLVALVTGVFMWIHKPILFSLGVWKNVHIYVSFLMAVTAIVHFLLNWPAYWGYLKHRMPKRGQLAEFSAAFLLTTVLCVVLGMNAGGPPKTGGAKLDPKTSLQQIVKDYEKSLVDTLAKQGFKVQNPTDSLSRIAEENQKSPDVLIMLIQRQMPQTGDRPK